MDEDPSLLIPRDSDPYRTPFIQSTTLELSNQFDSIVSRWNGFSKVSHDHFQRLVYVAVDTWIEVHPGDPSVYKPSHACKVYLIRWKNETLFRITTYVFAFSTFLECEALEDDIKRRDVMNTVLSITDSWMSHHIRKDVCQFV